ncbi:MAG: DUF4174 domain-containing protein [Cyanobacteria bacterium P01_C01_bin.118]
MTGVDSLMEDYQWENRVVLVFAPDSDDALLTEQIANFSGMGAGFSSRDLIVVKIVSEEAISLNGKVDTNLASQPFYEHFSVQKADFTVMLVGKDGTIKLRQNQPVTSQRLFSVIDAMPMRQREMRERGR